MPLYRFAKELYLTLSKSISFSSVGEGLDKDNLETSPGRSQWLIALQSHLKTYNWPVWAWPLLAKIVNIQTSKQRSHSLWDQVAWTSWDSYYGVGTSPVGLQCGTMDVDQWAWANGCGLMHMDWWILIWPKSRTTRAATWAKSWTLALLLTVLSPSCPSFRTGSWEIGHYNLRNITPASKIFYHLPSSHGDF